MMLRGFIVHRILIPRERGFIVLHINPLTVNGATQQVFGCFRGRVLWKFHVYSMIWGVVLSEWS